MKTICLPVLCLGFISIGSCNPYATHGSGTAKTETRPVPAFTKIDLAGSPDVEVSVGPAASVNVTTDDNLLPQIQTTVDGDTLHIGSKGSYSTHLGVKVVVTVPSLRGASISGSGNIRVSGLKGEEMEAGITGSGDITLSGSVNHLDARVTGSGDLRANDLAANDVHVSITGSGDASVRPAGELDAKVTGSGSIHYLGHPAQIHRHITGSGDIEPR